VIASGRWRPVGPLALSCALFGCSPLVVWDFDDDAGAPGVEATTESTADAIPERTFDATVGPEADTGVPPEERPFDAHVGEPTDGRVPRFDGSDAFRRHDGGEPPPVDASSDGSTFERCETECQRVGLHCLEVASFGIVCVACVEDSQCSTKAQARCDPQLHRCVACESDTDCDEGNVCITSMASPTHTCVPSCTPPHVCPIRAAYCDPQRSVCVACLKNADCDSSQVCNVTSGQCVDCTADSDCWNKLMCDPTTDKCVECLRSSDCGRGLCNAASMCVPFPEDE
jgi:Cys-rich repeat protein